MRAGVHSESEREFREWFEQNLSRFGIREIILNQEVCPDYVVKMENGDVKKVEAELFAINFKYHKHRPEKADLIVACYANETHVEGVPVIAVNKLWEYDLEPEQPPPSDDEPLSEDELLFLNIVQFHGGIELTALCQGKFAGDRNLYVRLTPDVLAKWPRGKVDDSIFNVITPK